jgi:hypothetical protein
MDVLVIVYTDPKMQHPTSLVCVIPKLLLEAGHVCWTLSCGIIGPQVSHLVCMRYNQLKIYNK